MIKLSCVFVILLFSSYIDAQPRPAFEIHGHITSKHYMNTVSHADSISKVLERNGELPPIYLTNWKIVQNSRNPKEDSHWKNYYQATYGDLQKGNFHFAIQAISPLEPNVFHDRNLLFRYLTRKNAIKRSHFEKSRFRNLINTSSWREAYNELLYTLNQNNISPDGKHSIYFPKNSDSLKKHINDENTTIGLFSFEGAHILFGDKVFKKKEFRNPTLSASAKDEVRSNVNFLRNQCEYRTFFITPIHIYWNTLGGHAKAVDKIEVRNQLKAGFKFRLFRKKIDTQYGSGLPPVRNKGRASRHNPGFDSCRCPDKKFRIDNSCFRTAPVVDPFGVEVLTTLLDPNNKWQKPIYIDVKHMDVRSRLDYYLLHDSLLAVKKAKDSSIKIPIIYSHGAVSGEKLKVAYYTQVAPMRDRYEEIEDPEKFYKDWFLDPKRPKSNCGLFKDYGNNKNAKYWFEGDGMKDPLITPADVKLCGKPYDVNVAGWFYPWSINLFDEEIKKIYDSDGIIGVMAEERTLGWYLPKYQDSNYIMQLRDSLIAHEYLKEYGLNPKQDTLRLDSFRIAETFLRNVFYIVRHSGRTDSTAWHHVGFGSDFDGFINPIDICETAGDVPGFQEYLIKIIPIFLKIHPEYHFDTKYDGLLFGLKPDQAMTRLFYENGKQLVLKYF